MTASMSSWRRSSNRSRKPRPPTAAKGSPISASRGQGRGVVEVSALQSGGGARRWLTRWLTLLTTTTLHSQRARPRRCGWGLAWKALLEAGWHGFRASAAIKRSEAAPRVSALARRVVAPHLEGEDVEGATPCFLALVRHERGQGRTGLRTPYPPLYRVAPSTVIPGGKAIKAARIGGGGGSRYRRTASEVQLDSDQLFPLP